MQENKFKEAIHYYEPIITKHEESIVEVTAIVLANLCVSYIMTSQNEKAEDLMRRIEREEEQIAEGEITSLKHLKDDAKEIKEGFECGIGVDQFSKFKEGDVIVCFEIQSIKRKLELK